MYAVKIWMASQRTPRAEYWINAEDQAARKEIGADITTKLRAASKYATVEQAANAWAAYVADHKLGTQWRYHIIKVRPKQAGDLVYIVETSYTGARRRWNKDGYLCDMPEFAGRDDRVPHAFTRKEACAPHAFTRKEACARIAEYGNLPLSIVPVKEWQP